MDQLLHSELKAAGWGASWSPDARDRRAWLEFEEWPPPDEAASPSGDAPEDWPPFEQFTNGRLALLDR